MAWERAHGAVGGCGVAHDEEEAEYNSDSCDARVHCDRCYEGATLNVQIARFRFCRFLVGDQVIFKTRGVDQPLALFTDTRRNLIKNV